MREEVTLDENMRDRHEGLSLTPSLQSWTPPPGPATT
jgi:hypothetical protein